MFDETSNPFDNRRAPVIPEGLLAKTSKAKHAEEFKSFDRRSLCEMNDKGLADWQSQYQTDEPQWRLAEQEWQRRQNRGASIRGWVAIGISVISLIVAVIALLRK